MFIQSIDVLCAHHILWYRLSPRRKLKEPLLNEGPHVSNDRVQDPGTIRIIHGYIYLVFRINNAFIIHACI